MYTVVLWLLNFGIVGFIQPDANMPMSGCVTS